MLAAIGAHAYARVLFKEPLEVLGIVETAEAGDVLDVFPGLKEQSFYLFDRNVFAHVFVDIVKSRLDESGGRGNELRTLALKDFCLVDANRIDSICYTTREKNLRGFVLNRESGYNSFWRGN